MKERLMGESPSSRPWVEVAILFLKLGVISFGGPAAHIALMEQETVHKTEIQAAWQSVLAAL